MIRLRTLNHPDHQGRIRLAQAGRCAARRRGSHNPYFIIEVIDPITAGERLSVSPWILEVAANHQMISHYRIAGQVRFDPKDLDAWIKRHRIDEIGIEDGLG